jgi:hypothetical protein
MAGDWHESAFKRLTAGLGDEWDKVLEKNRMAPEKLSGIFAWCRNHFPQKYQKLKECEDRIDELWVEGKTDGKAMEEFNEQLRIYRNGHLWLIDKFVAWKKEQTGKPAQGKLI